MERALTSASPWSGSPPDRDTELERLARAGDPAAFGQVIRKLDPALRGVAWSVLGRADGIDDVMQVAYEKAFRAISSFDGRSSLRTWLGSICYRAAIDHVRHEGIRRHDPVDELIDLQSAGDTEKEVFGRMELDEVLVELDSERRVMLLLTYGFGYSFDETAAILGRRRGTVASRVGRIRRRLARWDET